MIRDDVPGCDPSQIAAEEVGYRYIAVDIYESSNRQTTTSVRKTMIRSDNWIEALVLTFIDTL